MKIMDVTGMPELSRAVVESTARIVGPNSAAAQALRDADSHPGPVRFLHGPHCIIVQKLPADPGDESYPNTFDLGD